MFQFRIAADEKKKTKSAASLVFDDQKPFREKVFGFPKAFVRGYIRYVIIERNIDIIGAG